MYDFTPMISTVPMWGSDEVAYSKTEIHLTNTASEVMWACNVTTIEHEGDITSLCICYCVWFTNIQCKILASQSMVLGSTTVPTAALLDILYYHTYCCTAAVLLPRYYFVFSVLTYYRG